MPNASLTIDGTEVISKENGIINIKNTHNLTANVLTNSHSRMVGFVTLQIFETVGTTTWTKPVGVNFIKVYVTGGGGGGGSHNSDDAQGGGGAGGTAIKWIDVREITSVSVTVGVGGTRSIGNSSSGGGPGGVSSFGSYCSATGGEEPETWAVGGYGGVATGGDINLFGNAGICGNIDGGGNEESSGVGGASYWGGTGRGGSHWGARSNPRGWGSGGSGTHASTDDEGTDGYKGVVIVEEYV